jgi:hypothetical protein
MVVGGFTRGRGHPAPQHALPRLAEPCARYAALWPALAACLPTSVGIGLARLPGCTALLLRVCAAQEWLTTVPRARCESWP